ncbi:hypothetical protein EVAR_38432_1 [Eumeta japonica]|uniref:Uncharacterized protein n=1 Tax=Eumeta variegata TaxID=151549 RepID=A0A4C1X0K7_EUMVA|nr:hypothetical protein EVAR_38432_1 [Eumeta japonica]
MVLSLKHRKASSAPLKERCCKKKIQFRTTHFFTTCRTRTASTRPSGPSTVPRRLSFGGRERDIHLSTHKALATAQHAPEAIAPLLTNQRADWITARTKPYGTGTGGPLSAVC